MEAEGEPGAPRLRETPFGEERLGLHQLSVRLCGLVLLCARVPHWLGVLLGQSVQRPPLELPGLVVEEDPDEDDDGPHGAEQGHMVTEDDDAQPHGEGVLDRAGHTEGDG